MIYRITWLSGHHGFCSVLLAASSQFIYSFSNSSKLLNVGELNSILVPQFISLPLLSCWRPLNKFICLKIDNLYFQLRFFADIQMCISNCPLDIHLSSPNGQLMQCEYIHPHLVRFLSTPWTEFILCPWNFPGKNTGVGCHFLLQGIFLSQRLNLYLLRFLHWQVNSLPLHRLGNLSIHKNVYD